MDNLGIDLEEIIRQEGCLSWRQREKKNSENPLTDHENALEMTELHLF